MKQGEIKCVKVKSRLNKAANVNIPSPWKCTENVIYNQLPM